MYRLSARFLVIFLLLAVAGRAQQAVVDGIVRNAEGKLLDSVLVVDEATGVGGRTNVKGYYMINIPAGKAVKLIYYAEQYQLVRLEVNLKPGTIKNLPMRLKKSENALKEAVVRAKPLREISMVQINMIKEKYNPSIIGGVEALIKMQVGSNNELSAQYNVRGGNYDENLVYVNDFEIYRPFLVRTGQQEGLSFVNPDLVSNVSFSVGGFQAKYGDKMSSVLDVTYKKPKQFGGSVTGSLLGTSLHLEGISKKGKLTYLLGARQKSNQYILQAQATKGIYYPSFSDVQALIDYKVNDNWTVEVIGNYARNRFTFFPQTQVSSFGVLNQAYQLDVFYDGGEFDQFDSRFAGISATFHRPESRLKLKFLASGFQTNEYETYDIGGEYLFGELQTDLGKKDFGQIKTYLGTGYIHTFARNYLNVSVGDVGFRGAYESGKHTVLFGLGGNITSIADRLHEWERRDSSRYNQPADPYNIVMAYFFHSATELDYMRFTAFAQDNIKLDSAGKWNTSLGVRLNYSLLNGELLVSPRAQLSYKPVGEGKRDIIYKFAAGVYGQPPFYREMRDLSGNVNKQLRAQKSAQIDAGLDYNFQMYKREFRFTFETYYKKLWDLDPYFFDNVRIRYTGKNDAEGHVYGAEARLFGDLVKDATSWISIGVLKAEQKITDSPSIAGYNNYFPLASDQRFMLGMYFEDYLRKHKNYKAHINMMYSTGLPVGPPNGHLYQRTIRLPDYKRVDIGFSALLLDADNHVGRAHSYFNSIRTIWASLEVFNLLSIQNTLSYTWIQDNSTNKVFAVPNRLTTRLLNVKVLFNF